MHRPWLTPTIASHIWIFNSQYINSHKNIPDPNTIRDGFFERAYQSKTCKNWAYQFKSMQPINGFWHYSPFRIMYVLYASWILFKWIWWYIIVLTVEWNQHYLTVEAYMDITNGKNKDEVNSRVGYTSVQLIVGRSILLWHVI